MCGSSSLKRALSNSLCKCIHRMVSERGEENGLGEEKRERGEGGMGRGKEVGRGRGRERGRGGIGRGGKGGMGRGKEVGRGKEGVGGIGREGRRVRGSV